VTLPPDQVLIQHHLAAARADIAIDVAVHRDIAAGDVALFLHVAEFLVAPASSRLPVVRPLTPSRLTILLVMEMRLTSSPR
jgi:hypothetical protein